MPENMTGKQCGIFQNENLLCSQDGSEYRWCTLWKNKMQELANILHAKKVTKGKGFQQTNEWFVINCMHQYCKSIFLQVTVSLSSSTAFERLHVKLLEATHS